MSQYVIRRLLSTLPVLFGITLIVTLFIHIIPGDPADVILGDLATQEEKNEFRSQLKLDLPLHQQLVAYYQGLLSADLGESLVYRKSVTELIKDRIYPTIELAFFSLIVAILIGIPLGIFSALKSNTLWDFSAMSFSMIGVCMPNFWLGPMLILFFSLQLDLFPVSERGAWDSYVLPCLTLGTSLAAILARMMRTSILENLGEMYVTVARAKGLKESQVILKHVLRNSAIPVVTILGLQLGVLLAGSIITEKIFDWPGLGSLIVEAINNRDYPVVQGCVLLFSFFYVMANLVTDLLYSLIDPRISFQK